MPMTSIGDLSQSYMLQRRSTDLKTQLTQLTTELSTGQVSDISEALDGNFSYLAAIESDMKTLESYAIATTEAGQYAESIQIAIGRMFDLTSGFSRTLISTSNGTSRQALERASDEAEAQLNTLISTLNSDVAGRSLFAGTATDRAPLADADTILAGLRAAVAGETTVAGIQTAASDWFDDPAGFAATAYNGSAEYSTPIRVAENERVQIDLKADDDVFRDMLRETALAALATDGALGLGLAGQSQLQRASGNGLLSVQDGLISAQATVGSAEARIEDYKTRHAAERTSLEFAKGNLLQVDEFETATRLEEVRFQLEALYSITARVSDLSLLNFIR
ncbi:MAG: flagellin [Paracoccaceae bacterium]